MQLTRRTFSVFLGAGIFTAAFAGSPADENVMLEILLDTAALIKSGEFSYNDYKPKALEVVLGLDKYKRRNGTNVHLIAAAMAYIEAKKQWDIRFEVEREYRRISKDVLYVSEERLNQRIKDEEAALSERDKNWASASEHLDLYAKLKNPKSKSTSKKKPATS